MLAKVVSQPYLDQIRSGRKTYEGRLASKIDEWGLELGQFIKFYDEHNSDISVVVKVISLTKFPDFGTAFDEFGDKLIPDKTRNEVVQIYNDIYSPDLIRDIGVVIIDLELIQLSP